MFWKILSFVSAFVAFFFLAQLLQWGGVWLYKVTSNSQHAYEFFATSRVIPSLIFAVFACIKTRKAIWEE